LLILILAIVVEDDLHPKQMVAALLDRLRHRCTTVPINGPSLRS